MVDEIEVDLKARKAGSWRRHRLYVPLVEGIGVAAHGRHRTYRIGHGSSLVCRWPRV